MRNAALGALAALLLLAACAARHDYEERIADLEWQVSDLADRVHALEWPLDDGAGPLAPTWPGDDR